MATRDELAAPSTSLEELADWRAVLELSTRYATGIDQRDWSLYRRCFTDQLRIDFSSFTHRPAPTDPVAADDWVGMVRGTIEGFESTQHLIGNQVVTLRGDEGGYTAYIQAQHWMSRDRWYLIGGWYENQVRREADGWCISACTLHQTWDAGDRDLLREAARRVRDRTGT
jgi:SnoaL-like domain